MPNNFPPPLTQLELDTFYPLVRPPIAPGIFEIGLVLGGTVSAGAYTAGVLDYFYEALDAWTAAKEQGSAEAPPHDVVISTIAGTSGGAINGALFLRASGWRFPYGPDPGNPFYSSWTAGVDLEKLLSADPEPNVTGFASVLNCSAISNQAKESVGWTGDPLGIQGTPKKRSYLADPLRLTMMVGNVTGLPYSMSFQGETGLTHDMVAHKDYIQFALTVPNGIWDNSYRPPVGAPADTEPQRTRPGEIALTTTSPNDSNWSILSAAATATSAFPLMFRSRPLQRSLEACGYQVVVAPGANAPAQVMQLIPKWQSLADAATAGVVPFVNVDGGVFNNQPLDLVRTSLAGMDGRNDRDGKSADRTVILINPFSDPEMLGPTTPPDLPDLILPFVMAMVYQSRFKPEDIVLAQDPSIYSRFLIAPYGPGDGTTAHAGKAAITSGGLGGFLGFLDTKFLQYDYKLGRRNAYEFLSEQFVFPDENKAFRDATGNDKWTPEQVAAQRPVELKYAATHRRMIPLMKALRDNPPPAPAIADWPMIDDVPANIGPAIEARLDVVYDQVTSMIKPNSWISRAFTSFGIGLAWKFWLRGMLRDAAVSALRDGLKDQHLVPPAIVPRQTPPPRKNPKGW